MVSRMILSSPANGEAGTVLTGQLSSNALQLEENHTVMNEPGKSFERINVEEIMKDMWVVEDSKVGVAAVASSGLDGQNSLSLPPPVSNRTVDDVWRDIQRLSAADLSGKQQDHLCPDSRPHPHPHPHPHQHPHERQTTIGDMTLEDFLFQFGIVGENPDAGSHTSESKNLYPSVSAASAANSFSTTLDMLAPGLQADWMNLPPPHHQHQQLLQQPEAIAAAKRGFQPPPFMLPVGSPMYDGLADSVLGPDRFAGSLALSPVFSDYSSRGRKRFASEVAVEKTMERRQKRMIKNRESAARSRARKQAYTVELEAEVTLLKEENARLKQQQILQGHLSEAMRIQNSKLCVLRRTQSF